MSCSAPIGSARWLTSKSEFSSRALFDAERLCGEARGRWPLSVHLAILHAMLALETNAAETAAAAARPGWRVRRGFGRRRHLVSQTIA